MRTLPAMRAALTALLCAAAVIAQDPSPAVAQAEPSVGVGSRVRITSPSLRLKAATGSVREATDGTLLVQLDNPRHVIRIERDAITALDVSIQSHRRVLKGLGMGALAGAGGGALLGLLSGDDPPGTFLAWTAEEKALIGGAFFGATGAVVGLIAGALTRSDVWTPAMAGPTPPVGVSLLPFTSERGTGLRVGFSVPVR